MYRVVKMHGNWYSCQLAELDLYTDETIEDLQEFIFTGDPVILGDTLEDIAYMLGIEVKDIVNG